MDEQTASDLQGELAALRQRLGKLEAKHRELLRHAARVRRPAFSRKFLLSSLPVAILLVAGGVLYALDALSIDNQGNATFVGNVGIGSDASQKTLNVVGKMTASDATVTGSLSAGALTVTGNATVSGLSIAGGSENLRLLRGMVDGEKKDGVGFTAGKPIPSATGLYYVDFIERFSSMPAAFVSAFNENEKGDHSAIITRLSEGGMWVKTVNRSGQAEERKFSFVVIGPR